MSFFPGDIYLSFGFSDVSLALLFCGFLEFLETLVILSAVLLPIKSSVAFSITLFGAALIASAIDFFKLSRSFWPYLLLYCVPMLFVIDKSPYPFT